MHISGSWHGLLVPVMNSVVNVSQTRRLTQSQHGVRVTWHVLTNVLCCSHTRPQPATECTMSEGVYKQSCSTGEADTTSEQQLAQPDWVSIMNYSKFLHQTTFNIWEGTRSEEERRGEGQTRSWELGTSWLYAWSQLCQHCSPNRINQRNPTLIYGMRIYQQRAFFVSFCPLIRCRMSLHDGRKTLTTCAVLLATRRPKSDMISLEFNEHLSKINSHERNKADWWLWVTWNIVKATSPPCLRIVLQAPYTIDTA